MGSIHFFKDSQGDTGNEAKGDYIKYWHLLDQ